MAIILVLIAPILIACGETASTRQPADAVVASQPATVASQPLATPPQVATPDVEEAMQDAGAPQYRNLTPAELLEYKPNELGGIPIFMYHNVVSDPTLEGHLYRTHQELYADLQWLYDNDFYLVGMNSVIRGEFDVPAGKHPAVLTFDDSSSMHLSFELGPDGTPLRDDNGDYIVSPNCAVGVIERFGAENPGSGKTAHFAIIPDFGFSWPNYDQNGLYEEKLVWLVENGYEVGNHTSEHPDLAAVSTSDFARNIAEPYIWTLDVVDPDHPNFAMDVLTLPYGSFPEGGWTDEKRQYLATSYVWDGHEINVKGALLVCCGANPSPFHDDYRPLWINRMRGDDPDFAELEKSIEQGWVTLYTSDGNPETVTVPWPLPKDQWGKLKEEAISSRGLTLIKYHPETGKMYIALGPRDREAYNWVERAFVSA